MYIALYIIYAMFDNVIRKGKTMSKGVTGRGRRRRTDATQKEFVLSDGLRYTGMEK